MAVRNIAVTDSLETFRTEFNALAANDMGDIANLSGSISATNLVDAMNETISIATSTAGFTVRDSSSSTQLIGGGDVLSILGTTNEIEAVVSATDTVTIGLPNAVSITTSLTAPTLSTGNMSLTNGSITDSSGAISFGNENLTTTGTLNAGAITGTSITGSGATHTLGTIEISGNTIRSTDSTTMIINDNLTVNNSLAAGVTTINPTGANNIESSSGFTIFGSSIVLNTAKTLIFEGATADSFETELTVTDPTAGRTITLPDETGTVALTGSTGWATGSIFTSSSTLNIYDSSGSIVKTIIGSAT